MKARISLILSLVAAPLAAQQDPFTYETPRWIYSHGDFGNASPDGRIDVALVDKSDGTITIGLQRVDGGFDWTAPEPTGFGSPTGLAVGMFNNVAASQVAVTAPTENRASVFTPGNPATPLGIRHVFPALVATQSIAAFHADGDGASDLLGVGDVGGSGAHYYWNVTANTQTTPTSLWSEFGTSETARIWTFRQKALTPPLVAAIRGSQFLVATVGTGGLTNARTLAGFLAVPAMRMTYGNYDATLLAQVLLYTPGETIARTVKVTESPPGNFGWGTLATLTFPKPVRLIVTVPSSAGARLAVLFTDTTAATYDFNGSELALRSNLPGNGYEMLAPVGTHGLLSRNSANAWQRWDVSSSSATLTAVSQGTFPPPSPAASVSNIIFVTGGEPYVNPDATPVYFGHVHDWTTAASGGGSSWSVTSLTQSPAGLGNGAIVNYNPVPGARHALVNQFRSNVSVRTLTSAAGPNVGDVLITPPAGNYPPLAAGEAFLVTFASTQPGGVIRFRLAPGASWNSYDPNVPPSIGAPATVQAFAQFGVERTPTRSAAYTFAAESPLTTGALVDLDGDGLPDQWEEAFAAYDPDGDEDGDGSNNRDEYRNGTDPRDAASFIGGNAIVLNANLVGSGPTLALRLSWPIADTTAVLQTSSALTAWTDVTGGITTTATEFVYTVPLGGPIPNMRYYRLRRP